MKATIATQKAGIVILYLTGFGLLLVLYACYLVPFWEYMGFEADPNAEKIAVAACVIAAFSLLTPLKPDARSFFLNLMLTVYLLPSMTIFSYANKPITSALVIWAAFAVVYATSSIPIPRAVLFRIRAQRLMPGLALATAVLLASYYAFSGLHNFNLDISKVYEFRREASSELPAVFGYLSSAFTKIIIPFGLVSSLAYRKYSFSILFISCSVMIFGFTSNKDVLFSPVLSICVYYFINKYSEYTILLLLFILMLIVGIINISFIYYYGMESAFGWYNTLLIRRSLMVPSMIDYHYLSYFSENPFYLWSNSKISLGLFPQVYDLQPPHLIGKLFFGSADTSANTGFIGSGFAQAGLAGVLAYSAGAGLVISILRAYGRHLGFAFVAAVMADLIFMMTTSTDFLTLFLTHGLFLALLLLSLTRPPPQEERARPQKESRAAGPVLSES